VYVYVQVLVFLGVF